MNLNQLKIFYLAAKRRNLSVAAAELFITQPAVTKGLQRLQEYYDMKFVDHIGKKLVLTDAGEVLYEIAEKIFELESKAEESIRDFQERKRGRIRILSSESFGDYYLPRIIIPFSKAYPLVRITMNILPTEQVIENTATLNNDLGFISYPVEHKKLLVKEVLEDQLVIITPPDHPLGRYPTLEPSNLEDQLLIMHETGSAPRKALENYVRKNDLSVSIHLELSSNRAIKRAVEDGIGIALISRKVANEEIRNKRLRAIPLSDRSMTRKFYMVHHQDKYLSESLQNFIDMVFKWAAEYMRTL
ncbi:MAG: LysR family transcriptional regulator [Deltaproteobacteria bacterium]|jgi:DNA-binding transcriptional LysR family regulator|nr:LysR family transcriptional regulator [Deltaproteobacteria bacterium]MBW2582224.1 LysR family transcriptional regulator [Deltaproteobacteria bacterium]